MATCLGLPVKIKELPRAARCGSKCLVAHQSNQLGFIQSSKNYCALARSRNCRRTANGRDRALYQTIFRRFDALIQIMNPGGAFEHFDLLCIPTHDPIINDKNVMTIIGSPHEFTPDALADARSVWMPKFADLPTPYFALMVGGSTRRQTFTPSMARELASRASARANAGGRLAPSHH